MHPPLELAPLLQKNPGSATEHLDLDRSNTYHRELTNKLLAMSLPYKIDQLLRCHFVIFNISSSS